MTVMERPKCTETQMPGAIEKDTLMYVHDLDTDAACSSSAATDTDGCPARDQFAEAYLNGFRRTTKFLLSRGLSVDAAVEVAQEAWVKGWEMLGQLRNPAMLSQWINSIALNIYRSQLRKPNLEALADISSPAHGLDSVAVEQVLKYCTCDERFLLKKYYLEGQQIVEIAQQQGCTELAARIRLLRTRRAVRARLNKRPASHGTSFLTSNNNSSERHAAA